MGALGGFFVEHSVIKKHTKVIFKPSKWLLKCHNLTLICAANITQRISEKQFAWLSEKKGKILKGKKEMWVQRFLNDLKGEK